MKDVFNKAVECYPNIQENEAETVDILKLGREVADSDAAFTLHKIYYISDLHLLHRLCNEGCKNLNDARCVVQKIIDGLLESIAIFENNILLIGGDTSSDFTIFELFVNLLRTSIDEKYLDIKMESDFKIQVIFVLGNHELWDFSNESFDDVVAKYQKVIKDNNMYLLHNNLIFKYDINNIEEISTAELNNLSKEALAFRLMQARIILFGGIGFAGYNERFNANQLIYKTVINRQQEIEESKKFEELYKKVCTKLSDKRVIIFTHMPLSDWSLNTDCHKGFVYLSGHTHKNSFYDDGEIRVYADNQIGYKQSNCRLKFFYLEDDYDIFEFYDDGIYEITPDEYWKFCRGKNIFMQFSRDNYKIFMLKKGGHYCFIAQNVKKKLLMLNGGGMKSLEQKDINYYYERMDKIIAAIKSPLDKFTKYQKQISNGIKAIGGSGTIHGAIVDIDFLNHIYVNPIDYKVTAYYATDIINKTIYSNVATLLQNRCPEIYLNYLKQIDSGSSIVAEINNLQQSALVQKPRIYFNTDIYRASREIKKMQKLNSNILSVWVEPKVKNIRGKSDRK